MNLKSKELLAMFAIKKILVPTDFSNHAAKAYNVAHKLASRFGARVDFIHIIQTLTHYNRGIAKLGVPLKTDEDLYPQLKKQAAHQMNRLMQEYISEGNRGEPITRIAAQPYLAITEYAAKQKYDLILMATLGEDDSNFLIGSVAEKVIRYASTPVLSTATSNLDEIDNILVPTDGSPNSFKTLPVAVLLAHKFEAAITLLYVQQTSVKNLERLNPYEPDISAIKGAIYAELREAVKDPLKVTEFEPRGKKQEKLALYSEVTDTTIDLSITIKKGLSVPKSITEYAKENADMVVMATHGYTGFDHMFIGSTAENVVRHARLPVITVKPDFAG